MTGLGRNVLPFVASSSSRRKEDVARPRTEPKFTVHLPQAITKGINLPLVVHLTFFFEGAHQFSKATHTYRLGAAEKISEGHSRVLVKHSFHSVWRMTSHLVVVSLTSSQAFDISSTIVSTSIR
jgi:hypothetical protein